MLVHKAQPGLIPQMSGFLTNQRLWEVTTFVDYVSDFVYVHLMRDLSLASVDQIISAQPGLIPQMYGFSHKSKDLEGYNIC